VDAVSVPGVHAGPLRPAYDAVIIGGGIQGLALGYELARRGVRDVCVLEASYPGAGASGRNGELIRSAFASPAWIGLFDLSLRKWQQLSAELGASTLFTRAGYLVLASDRAQVDLGGSGGAAPRARSARGCSIPRRCWTSSLRSTRPSSAAGCTSRTGLRAPRRERWAYVGRRGGVEVQAPRS
jgi:glycine/D-amino acid oxidase-like deaminating enzyme